MNRGFVRNLKVIGVWLSSLAFAGVTYIIVWLDRKIRFPLPFPRDVAALAEKKTWCINVLKKNGTLPQEAEVQEYKVVPLRQEVIFRSNAGIIEINYTIKGESKTLKCFAKFAPVAGSVWNRAVFNLQINHVKEIFFNRYFVKEDKAVAAPEVYYTGLSIVTGNLCLITEFMESIEEYIDEVPVPQLELALQAMAALHAQYWKSTSKKMNRVFTMPDSTVDFFDSMVGRSWTVPARKILVQSWCRMNEPQTVIHGDARIGNMMFPADGKGRFVMIDWQAVRQGKAAFDLAYFLVLSLPAHQRTTIEKHSVDVYYNYLVSKGVTGYSRQELEEDYLHACLCVLVLLSLPMLSGEASADGDGARIFSFGMNIWRERMQSKFVDFDYLWITSRYEITESEGQEAVAEMLAVIEDRLKRITG